MVLRSDERNLKSVLTEGWLNKFGRGEGLGAAIDRRALAVR